MYGNAISDIVCTAVGKMYKYYTEDRSSADVLTVDLCKAYQTIMINEMGPGRYVINTNIYAYELERISSDHLWPYVSTRFTYSKDLMIAVRDTELIVDDNKIEILYFSVEIDNKNAFLTGITLAVGSERIVTYREAALKTGLDAFFLAAMSAQIIISANDTGRKLYMLAMVGQKMGCNEQHINAAFGRPLLVSLDELISIQYPGIVTHFPDVVWTYLTGHGMTMPADWLTDYVLQPTNCGQRVEAMRKIAPPILASRIRTAFNYKVDLRAVLDRDEFNEIVTFADSKRPVFIRSSMYLTPFLRNMGDQINIATGSDPVYYYSEEQYWDMLNSTQNLFGSKGSHINCVHEYDNQDHGVVGAFDGCIVTTRVIPTLMPFYTAVQKNTIISMKGIFSVSNSGEGYGIGFFAKEAAINHRFKVRVVTMTRNSECPPSMDTTGYETSYKYTVTQETLQERRSFLTEAQNAAVASYGIPITISLWRTASTKFTTEYDHIKHRHYAGFFLPTSEI
jgi:hypothetical protein